MSVDVSAELRGSGSVCLPPAVCTACSGCCLVCSPLVLAAEGPGCLNLGPLNFSQDVMLKMGHQTQGVSMISNTCSQAPLPGSDTEPQRPLSPDMPKS